jgi:hypothetical protein
MDADRFANAYGLTFHHLGLAVKTPDVAAAFLSNLGYRVGATVFDPIQNVHLALCEHPAMPAVEIICPGPGKSPIDRYLQQHKEGLVYHMCFAAKDLEGSMAALKADQKVRAIFWAAPQPAVLFDGRKVVFCIVDGLGLIELLAEARD